MKKIFLLLTLLLLVFAGYHLLYGRDNDTASENNKEEIELPLHYALYQEIGLSDRVCYKAFEQAMTGYDKIEKEKEILTLIDFSKPSTEQRFFVIDMEKKEILFESVVAHGKNSGENQTTSFSNKPGSLQSCLGFFLTGNSYQGGNGYSLIIDGLEKEINDNAKKRSVVIHGADYAHPRVCQTGRLGRSWGCPALPHEITKPVIDAIKNGSVLYAYSESHNEDYLIRSSYFD